MDNSTQSYFHNANTLRAHYASHGKTYKLLVDVSYDPVDKVLVIADNAFGMEIEDFTRAVVLDRPPMDRTGRSEFGMGLKTAACWFGTSWEIETTQFGSTRGLRAAVDVEELARTHRDTIEYQTFPAALSDHYTRITIRNVLQPIRGRTVGRVRDQLSSMYREDLRSNEIEIRWNMVPLTFEEPPILQETTNSVTTVWKKQVAFRVPWEKEGTGLPVKGWIAVRNPGKQRDAGLVLLRRGRVIIGGPDEGYKPADVFGQGNTYRSQRLIGELHMDVWPVTQAKDGFDWADGLEDSFIECLVEECKVFGAKAEDWRAKEEAKPLTSDEMEKVAQPTKGVLADESFGRWVKEAIRNPNVPSTVEPMPTKETKAEFGDPPADVPPPASDLSTAQPNPDVGTVASEDKSPAEAIPPEVLREVSNGPVVYTLKVEQTEWVFHLHWQDKLTSAHWMEIDYASENQIEIYLNTGHPFFSPYVGDRGTLELLQKLVIALALAEKMARLASVGGRIEPGDLRALMNKVLRRIADAEEIMRNA